MGRLDLYSNKKGILEVAMTQSARKLLLAIARNPSPQKVFDKLKKGRNVHANPYKAYEEIVQHQINRGIKSMHLPEPWNGHISKAKILFISSNPSIDPNEVFPRKYWADDKIVNFFDNRFKNHVTGSIPTFWEFIAKNTSWIFPDETEKMDTLDILDKYVAITEVVHCKSEDESYIKGCLTLESQFLLPILKEFKGEIVIFVGDIAKRFREKNQSLLSRFTFTIAEIYHQNAKIKGLTDEKRKDELLQQL